MDAPSKCPKCGAAYHCTQNRGMDIEAMVFRCGTIQCVWDMGVIDATPACEMNAELTRHFSALDAALAEAVAVACKQRDTMIEKGDVFGMHNWATYWNDLACRWQDARAEANQKGEPR